MCQEVFNIVRSMDLKSLELQLALQCAPLITGIKISNLLIIDSTSQSALRVILKKSGISYFKMMQTKDKTAFLLFRRSQFEEYLSKDDIHDSLAEFGYKEFSLGSILRTIKNKYETYLSQGDKFPHELGILLGYPVEDVKGFIDNKGQNYLYSGYWKVYSNVPLKKRLFSKYEESKECLIHLLAEQIDMQLILEIYKEELPQKMAV